MTKRDSSYLWLDHKTVHKVIPSNLLKGNQNYCHKQLFSTKDFDSKTIYSLKSSVLLLMLQSYMPVS